MAIERAKQIGVACMALRNLRCHIGRIGTYGELCAEAGLVSMHHVNVVGEAASTVAPYGSREGAHADQPLLLRHAAQGRRSHRARFRHQSAVAMGKLRVAFLKGEEAPEGVLVDADGRPTRDLSTFYRSEERARSCCRSACTRAAACEILCELLGRGLGRTVDHAAGHGSFLRRGGQQPHAVGGDRPRDAFGGRESFEAEAEASCSPTSRGPRRRKAVDRVRLPGDPGAGEPGQAHCRRHPGRRRHLGPDPPGRRQRGCGRGGAEPLRLGAVSASNPGLSLTSGADKSARPRRTQARGVGASSCRTTSRATRPLLGSFSWAGRSTAAPG